MGVLKRITDEYFGAGGRLEDGMFVDIDGFKAFMPLWFNEYDDNHKKDVFLNYTLNILYSGEFMKRMDEQEEGYISIPCKNNFRFSLDEMDELLDSLNRAGHYSHKFNMENLKSMISFISSILKDTYIERDSDGYEYTILMDKEESNKRLYKMFRDSGLDKETRMNCYKYLKHEFCNRFDLIRKLKNDVKFSKEIIIYLSDKSGTSAGTIVNLNNMKKWLIEKFDEISNVGVIAWEKGKRGEIENVINQNEDV